MWTPNDSPVTRREMRSLAVVAAFAAVLRVVLLDRHGLASTELITWHVMGMPLGEVIVERLHNNHVPLYFASLRAWCGVFGRSAAALRLPSALLGVASVLVVWWVARRLFSPRAAMLAAWIVALHQYWTHTSLEARVYGPMMLGCLLALGAFWRWLETRRWGWAALYFAAMAAALGTQLLSITVAVSVFGWLATSGRRFARGARAWLVAAAPLVLLTPLAVLWFRMQSKVSGSGWELPEGGGRIQRDMLRLAFGDYDLVEYFSDLGSDLVRGLTLPLMTLTVAVLVYSRIRRRWADGVLDDRRRVAIDLLVWLIALPPLVVYLTTIKSDVVVGIARYMSVSAAFLPVLLAGAWSGLPEGWCAMIGRLFSSLFRRDRPAVPANVRKALGGILLVAVVVHTVAYVAYPGDGIRLAADAIRENPRDGDRLLIVAGGGLPYVPDYFQLRLPSRHILRGRTDEDGISRDIRALLGDDARRLFVLAYHADDSPALDVIARDLPQFQRTSDRELSEAQLLVYERRSARLPD